MLYLFLKQKGIPVVSFEHGITEGLARFNDFQPEIMEAADIKVYHTELSRDYNSKRSKDEGTFIGGLPRKAQRLRFRTLQRTLLRKKFSASEEETIIIDPTEVEINNFIFGPYIENDWEFYSKTRELIYDVFGKIPCRVCLKVYPENRYVDRGVFASNQWLPKNCSMVKGFDFRFIRAMGDILVTSSTYSTLGWVWGAGVPIIYLEYPFQPLADPVREFFKKGVYYFDCSSPGWKEDMVRLLNLPLKEVLEGWNSRKPYRHEHERYFMTGGERQDFIASLSASAKVIPR